MGNQILAAGLSLLAGIAFLGLSAKPAGAADGVEKFQIGSAVVWAVADSRGDRDMGVFPTADPEAVKRYVPSGKAPSAIMVFAIQDGSGVTLVDTGLGAPDGDRSGHRIVAGLAKAGITPEQVGLVLITHMHGDHIGGLILNGERVFPNAKVKISLPETDFWLDKSTNPPSRELARRVADAYAGRLENFNFGDTVRPGVLAVEAIGHTPGHTAFLFESGGEKLFFIGDLLHAAALQFPRPDINASYDMDPARAAAARRRLLERAAREKLPVAGIHLPFPGIGRVEMDGGGFSYRPGKD